MAFRLQQDEPITPGLRRVVEEQYHLAMEHLSGPAHLRQHAVHETRKSFKRVRSLLRMLRKEMKSVFAEENARIRDLSAMLSPYRDADAMLETLEKLHQAFPDILDANMHDVAYQSLSNARDKQLESGNGYAQDAQMVIGHLKKARANVANWPLPHDLEHIIPILRRSYKRARQAAKQAQRTQHIEDFHTWRKRVKDLQYQTQLLQETPAGLEQEFRQALKSLAELLGNHHDLSILEELLESPGIFPDQQHAAEVQPLVQQHRQELEKQALQVGRKLFERPAKKFFPLTGSAKTPS